jgi:F-type H+-transporting ATPase subunit a
MISNWSGLLPGVGSIGISEHEKLIPLFRAPTADLNTTLALAIVAIISVQWAGLKTLGVHYLSKFINFSSPVNFFVGILEIISEFSRLISFTFRLFGNIFAGEVLLAVVAFLIPAVVPVPFLGMEIFVGFIQALVFSMLTATFLSMAVIKEGH